MGPFSVSSSGSRVQTANGPQQLLAINHPLTKLDITKNESFQTISLLFNNEPPQPTPGNLITDTQIYQFAHGYENYIPAVWMTWQNPTPQHPPAPSIIGATATTFNDFGDETASDNIIGTATHLSLLGVIAYDDAVTGLGDYMTAFLYIKVGLKNVTLYVRKVAIQLDSGGNVVPIHLAGISVNIRLYVFTEPATTSTY